MHSDRAELVLEQEVIDMIADALSGFSSGGSPLC